MTTSNAHRDPSVAVRGHYTGHVPPDYAEVYIGVSARGSDRARTLTDLTERLEGTQRTIRGYGVAVERVAVDPLRVSATYKDNKPTERGTGYVGSVQVRVVVVDFSVLGDLLLRLADTDMVTVTGPYWALRRNGWAHAMARTEAVRDARARAEQYAEAAGSKLTGLVEIADTGLSGGAVAAGDPFGSPARRGAAVGSVAAKQSVADRVALEVEPAAQEVSASVEVRFTLAQPDFS